MRSVRTIRRRLTATVLLTAACTSCMKWDYGEEKDFAASGAGLFIACEGNFQYSNASLSYYDPETQRVENEIVYRYSSAGRLLDRFYVGVAPGAFCWK